MNKEQKIIATIPIAVNIVKYICVEKKPRANVVIVGPSIELVNVIDPK